MSALSCPSRWFRASRAAALTLVLPACMGGQTGGEFSDDEEYGGGVGKPGVPTASPPPDDGCSGRREVAFHDALPLGFSAADVLASAAGAHTETLAWQLAPASVSFVPEQGLSTVTLGIQYTNGRVFLVNENATAAGAAGQSCRSHLEIEVDARLTTSGGAFDEQFTTTIAAAMPGRVELSHELPMNALTGTFTAQAAPTFTVRNLQVNASISIQGFTGSIWSSIEQRVGSGDNASVGASSLIYALWPAMASATAPSAAPQPNH